jgi:hypothetical protein
MAPPQHIHPTPLYIHAIHHRVQAASRSPAPHTTGATQAADAAGAAASGAAAACLPSRIGGAACTTSAIARC